MAGGRNEGEVLTALALEAAGATHRDIAVAIWGEDKVAREFDPDGWMHSRVKRRLRRGRGLQERWLGIATGR